METVLASLISAFIAVVVVKLIEIKKSVSVSIISTDEGQAKELFKKRTGGVIPPEFVEIKKHVGSFEFIFKIKK